MRGFLATLENGKTIREDLVMTDLSSFIGEFGLHEERPWIILKKYLQHTKQKLVGLQLIFDHQGVFLPTNCKAYFYSLKVEAYVGGTNEQVLYYGIGASDRSPDEVEITWYDGDVSKIERRQVDAEKSAFIVN